MAAADIARRLGLAASQKKMVRKVFPEHWSFMLGEIALWSFVVLLVTGVFLTFWFDPSMAEVQYQGSHDAMRGIPGRKFDWVEREWLVPQHEVTAVYVADVIARWPSLVVSTCRSL